MNYVPIRLSTLRPKYDFDFNIYVSLSDKYVLYVKEGDDISGDRLQKLKEKKVRQLFIEDACEEKYQNFLDASLKGIADDDSLSDDDKAEVAQGVASSAVEDMQENPQSEQAYHNAQTAAEGLVDVIAKNPTMLKTLFEKVRDSNSEPMTKHSVNVAFLALSLGEMCGLEFLKAKTLGLAGLLHDIGRAQMPEDAQALFLKPYEEFSQDDWKIYKEHPTIGANMLQDKNYATQEVLDLIATHEEKSSGEGFPNKLQKLSLEQEILSLTACYDRMVTILGWDYKDALEEIQVNQLGNYDLELIQKFKKLLKAQGLM
jgi:putative nucleotidyltransferase with HDIG domain